MSVVQTAPVEIIWQLADGTYHRETYPAHRAKSLVDGIIDNLAPGETLTVRLA